MKARLVIYKGGKVDLAFPVSDGITGIGRDADNAVQLTDSQVSKHHAIIRGKDDNWFIEDSNSANGITVNGTHVKRAKLTNGDKIRVGHFELVFESNVTGEWVPSLVIDLSSKAARQTNLANSRKPSAKLDKGEDSPR